MGAEDPLLRYQTCGIPGNLQTVLSFLVLQITSDESSGQSISFTSHLCES